MTRCLGLSIFPGQYKSTTGLQRAGCPIRLKELNNANKVSPTKLQGAQVARENYIRRRVATIKQTKPCLKLKKSPNCDETQYAYGPVFGLKRGPRYGGRNTAKGCKGGGCVNVYYANGGSGNDVIMWKRLYGGSRTLFSTSNCAYGCCGTVGPEGLGEGCACYSVPATTTLNGKQLAVGDVLWPANSFNTPPIDLYDAVFTKTSNGTLILRCKNTNSYMSKVIKNKPNTLFYVYRQGRLKNWTPLGKYIFANVPASTSC